MLKVEGLLERGYPSVNPHASLNLAASEMKRTKCAALPVCQQGKYVAVVSERDIVSECSPYLNRQPDQPM